MPFWRFPILYDQKQTVASVRRGPDRASGAPDCYLAIIRGLIDIAHGFNSRQTASTTANRPRVHRGGSCGGLIYRCVSRGKYERPLGLLPGKVVGPRRRILCRTLRDIGAT
jgi:hypothetical protein